MTRGSSTTGAVPAPGHGGGRRPRRLARLVPALWVALMAGCGGDPPSILEPASDDSSRVAGLWWVLFWTSAVVVVIVTGFLVAAAVRRRRADPGWRTGADDDTGPQGEGRPPRDVDRRPVPWGDPFVIIAGIVIPGAVLAGTFAFSLGVLNDIGPSSDEPGLSLEVVSHNWWWEVRYPNGAVTANEIHIPVGERVELTLPTADIIHSFWVPELQVKEDHIPGRDNMLSLQAEEPGRFQGLCAEFCGVQHANMKFQVFAQPPGEFEEWLAAEAEPAAEPETATARRGNEILTSSSCAGCHTVRGTSADGDLGPDLTHLASRETIGAGLMPLTRENLADFVSNPQDDKPGITMPPTELTDDEVDAVVDYLMGLE